jgi:hypothetical protein
MRSVTVIGWTMLIFGIVLYWADQKGPQTKRDGDWTLRDAINMGLWQAVALIPGTSRSGITITAGRMLGYDRESAARLAMLMSIPTILASGVRSRGARSSPKPMRRRRGTAPSLRPWPSSPRSRPWPDDAPAEDRQLHALRDLPGDPRGDPAMAGLQRRAHDRLRFAALSLISAYWPDGR